MQRLFFALIFILGLLPLTYAQEAERFSDEVTGIALLPPEGWVVESDADMVITGTPQALETVAAGGVPQTPVLRVIVGSFLELGLESLEELPTLLTNSVPAGVSAPAPVEATFGGRMGWQVEYVISESDLGSLVGVASLTNGRVALIRGIAPASQWESALPEIQAVLDTLEFFVPAEFANPFADLPDDDGGLVWFYQGQQPAEANTVTLGGLTYDPFGLMYVAAGERGLLVVDEILGEFINYLGPLFDDDNFVDIAISRDARLFVANATAGDNNQVMVVSRAGNFEYGFGSVGDAPGQFVQGYPKTIAITRQDNVWVVSEGHATEPENRLYQFDRWGNLLRTIDLAAINPNLQDVVLDNNASTSGIYLLGRGGGGLNLLDADGNPLVTNLASEVFEQATPVDIALAPDDTIVVSTEEEGILQFSPNGTLMDRFGIQYDAEVRADRFVAGEMISPDGLVVGVDGTLYYAETNPASGFSQVAAFRFAGDGQVPLANRPDSGSEADFSNLDPAAGGGDITYGTVVQGRLNNQNPVHRYNFQGEAGDVIRITMRDITPDGVLDTRLILKDPNLFEIANVDDIEDVPDGFRSTDSIIEMEIRGFGFYTIEATRFGGRGAYELTIERLSP